MEDKARPVWNDCISAQYSSIIVFICIIRGLNIRKARTRSSHIYIKVLSFDTGIFISNQRYIDEIPMNAV